MMEPTIQQETHPEENGHRNNSIHSGNNSRYRDGRRVSPRHRRSTRRMRSRGEDFQDEYQPQSSSHSFCQWCCTFQHFCYVVQFVNCGLVAGLIYLVLKEYPKLQALEQLDQLQKQMDQNHADIEALQVEVHTKQEGQLINIEESLKQQERDNFLSFAGIFTLLTCLISMFHMTTHVHKLHQPKIQRKIIAILWMSPIYSVTSFLTLIFPPIEGWMAIVKDFYESYCIFVFLSFLIAVLGEGSRDKAVVVLAKHADHLDEPTRCLGCFYEPPPNTSDHAKANAVMTQCQIYCLQFTIIRPLTTIIRVFVFNRGKDDQTNDEGDIIDDEFSDSWTQDDANSNENYIPTNNTDWNGDEALPTGNAVEEDSLTETQPGFGTETSTSSNSTNTEIADNGGTRTLHYSHTTMRRPYRGQLRRDRRLDDENEETIPPIVNSESNNDETDVLAQFPSIAPISGNDFPSSLGEDFSPSIEGFPPTFDSPGSPASSPESVNAEMPTFGYNNSTDFGGIFNATGNFSSTFAPTLPPSFTNETGFVSDELVDETKAYFKSPGFALAMIVNVSIFFAFSGLLKLYHAVREDLLWCRPFPKFLTIKAVVFLTFWQGLAILIYLILTTDDGKDASAQAHRYQNMLICVEMLLVAISQWCVFPAVEWEPDYDSRNMQTPGLGIKDFVSDVGQIVKSRKSRKGRRRKKRGGTPNSSKSGLYHMPGFSSIVSSQFDGFGGPRVDSSFDDEDDFENSSMDRSYDSSSTFERDNENAVTMRSGDETATTDQETNASTYGLPPSNHQGNRDRMLSDDTGGYSVEDELSDHDRELL